MPHSVNPVLTDEERAILVCGLGEWGGPAAGTDEIARVIGFADLPSLLREGRVIAKALRSGEHLDPVDWRRALLATELVFASDLVGSGVEWPTTTGFGDEDTIRLLRSVQRKITSALSGT